MKKPCTNVRSRTAETPNARELSYEAFSNHGRELYAFIRKRTRDDDLAKDLLQDVFLKLLLTAHPASDPAKLRSWLYRVATNTIADHFKLRREQTGPSAAIPDEENGDLSLQRYEACLPQMLAQLETGYRQALELSMQGHGAQLIGSEQLGISYSGMKSRVQRARRKLRDLFQEQCGFVSDRYGNVIDDRCGEACVCTG